MLAWRHHRRSRAVWLLIHALIVILASAPLASATPSTPLIEQKQAEAREARAVLDRMNDELEVQVEEYNAVTEALEQTRIELERTRLEREAARRDLAQAKQQLTDRAIAIYKHGETTVFEVLLATTSFQDLITRIDLLRRISDQDARMLAETRAAKERVEMTERALASREAEQAALKVDIAARAARIKERIAEQQAYIAQLDHEVQRLIAQEEERQRVLAEERARRAAQAAANRGNRRPTPVGDLPAGHPEVVPIALRFLGVPYVWGGASPSGFDCSGLCQYVYEQIGIELPRTSRGQFRAGAHIPPDRLDLLRPGDLVFFGTDGDPARVHHVGIYVGDGDFIHAPQQGDVVKVSSLSERIATRGDYVGASRF